MFSIKRHIKQAGERKLCEYAEEEVGEVGV